MSEVLLFHHAQGLTDGVRRFADQLRAAGHRVTAPDLYGGRTFPTVEEGVAHAQEIGFEVILERGRQAAEELPQGLVYGGFSLGVMPAQMLAQTRPGAKGAFFLHGCLSVAEFGSWPEGVAVQIHGMDADPYFVGEGDIEAARDLVRSARDAALFLYPGDRHLFSDSGLADYDEVAAKLVLQRVLALLGRLDRRDPDPGSDELQLLQQYLDYQRQTVLAKAEGLGPADMARKVADSDLTLGGILYHLALVEESWLEVRFQGLPQRQPWSGIDWEADPNWEFRTGSELDPQVVRRRYREACQRSRQVVAAASGPAQESASPLADGRSFSLRWVLVHLIEETARHAGHADLLREAIDQTVGE